MSSKATAGGKSPSKRQRQSKSDQPIETQHTSTQPTPRHPSTKREADIATASEPEKGPQATLYDAVAGRVNRDGFILSSSKQKPAAPDEILFSRANAPVRYEETDPYFAHCHLPNGVKLPDSDLLKSVHAYVADFYGSGVLGDCELDWGSMDETALMAMGILLEEAAASKLGRTGDLAFVEGERKHPPDEKGVE